MTRLVALAKKGPSRRKGLECEKAKECTRIAPKGFEPFSVGPRGEKAAAGQNRTPEGRVGGAGRGLGAAEGQAKANSALKLKKAEEYARITEGLRARAVGT